ncbi:HD domain-containing protein [Maridesulfovibrio sp.]|uniref:HD domain-containing protein n=1 Tax=Maridesulfovibrio sp. TaxID=2795000 RepID=UPI002A18DC80|nr:HD domain-containing protein [Maridesulfovibrio sp.]
MSPDKYMAAWKFAAAKHNGQLVPGTELPYITHVGSVAMEVMAAMIEEPDRNADLAVCCALLHDTVEDTDTTLGELAKLFGEDIAMGVSGLTKDKTLPDKRSQMLDSLARLKVLPKAVQLVKLADRIVNLQPPPAYWTSEKCAAYRDEAQLIYDELKDASPVLAERLAKKIIGYGQYC